MRTADAMLHRPREHALDGQCDRDDPKQEEAGELVHLGRYRGLEQKLLARFYSRFVWSEVYSTLSYRRQG